MTSGREATGAKAAIAGSALGLPLASAAAAAVQGAAETLWGLHLLLAAWAAWRLGPRWGAAVAAAALVAPVAGALTPAGVGGVPGGREWIPVAISLAGVGAAVAAGLAARRAGGAGRREIEPTEDAAGLPSAATLFEMVRLEIERAQRYHRPFTLACLRVESAEGAQRGRPDEITRRIAHLLQGTLRGVDVVARRQDREFLLLLPETGGTAGRAALERISRRLETALAEDAPSLGFTAGAVTWISADLPVHALHQRAYQLMFGARLAGERVRYEVLGQEDDAGLVGERQAIG